MQSNLQKILQKHDKRNDSQKYLCINDFNIRPTKKINLELNETCNKLTSSTNTAIKQTELAIELLIIRNSFLNTGIYTDITCTHMHVPVQTEHYAVYDQENFDPKSIPTVQF